MNNWDRMPDALKEQVFQRLDQLAAVANLSEENRIAYDRAVDSYQISRIVEEDIRREGKEAGLKEGLKKGKKAGLKEGKKAAKQETALEMKKDGVPFATIAKYTGLSVKEIEQL